jgi:phosphoribosylcarboxyaminoimidazole (NCAIR) mutase
MGSHSDLPTMHAAVDILQQFCIPYKVDIVSAHRTPEKLMSYARTASDRDRSTCRPIFGVTCQDVDIVQDRFVV